MKLDASKKYALIESQKVTYIFTGEEIPEIDESCLKVVEIPAEMENRVWVGCEYKNGKLKEISLDDAKAAQIEYINNRFENEVALLQGEYVPKEEVLTYEMQRTEAQHFLLNHDESAVPFLVKLAETRGLPLEVLATKIMSKNEQYSNKLATIMGYRHAVRDRVLQASSHEEVMNITYKSPFNFE